MALSEWPWRAIFEGGIWRVVGPDGVVADLGSDQGDDAVLMASAPELLARVERLGGACRKLRDATIRYQQDAESDASAEHHRMMDRARAALAGDGEVSGRGP